MKLIALSLLIFSLPIKSERELYCQGRNYPYTSIYVETKEDKKIYTAVDHIRGVREVTLKEADDLCGNNK